MIWAENSRFNMNYQKHYDLLIERAKHREAEGYVEIHHILPRCMGGNDSADNLVKLYAEEHRLAHQLLVKIYPDSYKLVYALSLMFASNDRMQRSKNKAYKWVRELLSDTKKKDIKENGHHSKGAKRSEETKANISAGLKGRKLSESTKQKLREINLGKTHSAETKQKLAKIASKPCDALTKTKIGQANKGRKRVYQADGSFTMVKPNHK